VHTNVADLGGTVLEEPERFDLRVERRQDLAGPRPLHRQRRVVGRHVGDLDLVVPDEVAEVRQVGLGGGQDVVVSGEANDHPVLDHVPALIAPQRVLRLPVAAPGNVAC
jgi:hypothetical protein